MSVKLLKPKQSAGIHHFVGGFSIFCWLFDWVLLGFQPSILDKKLKVYQAVKGTERASFSQNMALDALLVTPQVARSMARSLKG